MQPRSLATTAALLVVVVAALLAAMPPPLAHAGYAAADAAPARGRPR